MAVYDTLGVILYVLTVTKSAWSTEDLITTLLKQNAVIVVMVKQCFQCSFGFSLDWQQQVEETLNEGGENSGSDESSDFDGHLLDGTFSRRVILFYPSLSSCLGHICAPKLRDCCSFYDVPTSSRLHCLIFLPIFCLDLPFIEGKMATGPSSIDSKMDRLYWYTV